MFLDKERSVLGMGAALTFQDFLFLEVSLSSTSDLPTKRKATRQQKAKGLVFILFTFLFFKLIFFQLCFVHFGKGLFWLQQKQTRILILKEPVKYNYEKITTLSKATNFTQPLLGSSLLKFSCYLDEKGRKRHKKKV